MKKGVIRWKDTHSVDNFSEKGLQRCISQKEDQAMAITCKISEMFILRYLKSFLKDSLHSEHGLFAAAVRGTCYFSRCVKYSIKRASSGSY